MTTATKPLSNRIAIVFDFDDTLVPDTFDTLLEHHGLDAAAFRSERVKPLLEDGWDKIPARFYCLIEESQQRDQDKITQASLANLGRNLQPFAGVPEMFERLRQHACQLVPEVEVDFYLITGGIAEIARHTSIAHHFKKIWGCDFHYAEDGEIKFLKKFVTHTEKTRYLFSISKGIEGQDEEGLLFVYRNLPAEELHVPLTQMIYVGDGASDIPCFSILNEHQGIAIGVYKDGKAQEWEYQEKVSANQRVVNLAPAEYGEESELMRSLTLAVESICKQIALLQLSVDE
ncbi:MAG: HAD family hydrolase [Cyanophyceae cyanobacterium]